MTGDAVWYEAAFVVGVTNALNVVADGLSAEALPPADERDAAVQALLDEVRVFYAGAVPPPFRALACDAAYARDLWGATRRAFEDARLSRRFKTALAFAVSLTTRSAFGTSFHRGEMRRLGVGDRGVVEIVGVTQMFSSYTKIADMLQLEPDMGDIAPVDRTGVPETSRGR